MGQKDRFVRTSRYDRWLRLRRLAWLVPLVALLRVWREFHAYFAEDMANAPSPMIGLLAVVIATVMLVFIYSLIPFFLWWCACTLLMSRTKREATFEPTYDLTYYRDTLKGLSAVQVSLLADLRVEPREDAAATLLALERRGIVSTEGEQVHVVDDPGWRPCLPAIACSCGWPRREPSVLRRTGSGRRLPSRRR